MAARLPRATARLFLALARFPAAPRCRLHTTTYRPAAEPPRGPTDLAALNVLGHTEAPSTAIEGVSQTQGFRLSNGVRVGGGDGIIIIGGETFRWRPWRAAGPSGGGVGTKDDVGSGTQQHACVNSRGQFKVPNEAFGILEALWPRPDLVVLGVGSAIRPLAPDTRQYLASLGVRVEVADTSKATGQYNLLATERGQDQIAAALMPLSP